MSHWHVAIDGRYVRLLHNQANDEGGVWSGTLELWRGAPDFEHPELRHAILAITNPAVHREFVRHTWSYEIPDFWGGQPNFGPNRRFLVLRARGGMLNWTLVLALPPKTPRFVWKAIARGFNAKKETAMKPMGPDQTAKPASLNKGPVPEPKSVPAATSAGIKSVVSGT